MIEDVLEIEPNDSIFEEVSLFNQSFKYVMVYGHVRRDIGSGKDKQRTNGYTDQNIKRYIIDDGSGKIRIRYTHSSAIYKGLCSITGLQYFWVNS